MADLLHEKHPFSRPSRYAYIKCLISEGVPENQHNFYLLRASQFVKAANGRHPGNLKLNEIVALFETLGRDRSLTDWQFAQLIDSVRILLAVQLKSSAASSVDWSFWKSSARTVSGGHATTAREHSSDELAYLKISKSTGKLAAIRKQHQELIRRLVTEIRARGYAYRTEEAYEQWVVRYILFCGGESPENTGTEKVAIYLHDLVMKSNVSASTQNQALNALIFLYKHVLNAPLGQLQEFARSKRKKHVPVVMSRGEVKALLAELEGWQQELAWTIHETPNPSTRPFFCSGFCEGAEYRLYCRLSRIRYRKRG